MLEKVALKRSSKSTKYELKGSYDELVHEFSRTYHTPYRFKSALLNNKSSAHNSNISMLIVCHTSHHDLIIIVCVPNAYISIYIR